VSGCDGEGYCDGCEGCPGCDGGWLVIFCCGEHGKLASSVGGSSVEFPNDGAPYARPFENYSAIEAELRADGFTVREVG
jgi:hypothetical protein